MPVAARAENGAGDGTFAVALEYAAPPGCPEIGDLEAIVDGRLGYDPFVEGASNHVFVRLASRAGVIEGRVEWRDATGKWVGDRSFPSRTNDCREIVRAVGFALALQIQLLTITSEPPGASEAAPTKPSPPPEAPPPLAPPAAVAPPKEQAELAGVTAVARSTTWSRPALALAAGGAVGFGLSSSAVALVRLLGSVAWPHLALELAAEVGLPATTRRADGAGFSQQELLASAAVCGVVARWSACVLGKGGEIRIAGEIDVPASPSGSIFQTGLRLAVTQPLLGRTYLTAHAEGLVNLTRWTVNLDQMPVWTAPRFAGTLGLAAGVHFP
jgi:hypothetical protein